MKTVVKKIADIIQVIYGYGILVCLFAGGLSFFGYLVALIIGGETATMICIFIYKTLFPYLVYLLSGIVLLGLIKMYLCGEKALVSGKNKVR